MRASKAAEKKVRTGLLQARDSRNPAQTDFRGENGQSNSIRRKHGQEAKYPVGGQSVPRCLRRSVRSDRLRFSIRVHVLHEFAENLVEVRQSHRLAEDWVASHEYADLIGADGQQSPREIFIHTLDEIKQSLARHSVRDESHDPALQPIHTRTSLLWTSGRRCRRRARAEIHRRKRHHGWLHRLCWRQSLNCLRWRSHRGSALQGNRVVLQLRLNRPLTRNRMVFLHELRASLEYLRSCIHKRLSDGGQRIHLARPRNASCTQLFDQPEHLAQARDAACLRAFESAL